MIRKFSRFIISIAEKKDLGKTDLVKGYHFLWRVHEKVTRSYKNAYNWEKVWTSSNKTLFFFPSPSPFAARVKYNP